MVLAAAACAACLSAPQPATADAALDSGGNGNDCTALWSGMIGAAGSPRLLEGVWGSGPGDVFAVGDGGFIVHFGGSAWSAMTSGTQQLLSGVWGSGRDDVFAVGDGGTIVHFNGAGSTWSPMASGITEPIYGVWGSGPNDVFAVGGSSTGTIVHFNGSAWSPMASGATQSLFGVWGSGPRDVFAVGGGGTIVHFNGSAWSAMTSGTPQDLWKVWGSGPGDVFAVGGGGTIVHFNGSAWSAMNSGTSRNLQSVWSSGPGNVFAVGYAGTIARFNGSAWAAMTFDPSLRLLGVWGSGPSDVFVVGTVGTILHYLGCFPNLVANGDFETGLWGWLGYNATLAQSQTAHGGSYSCQICRSVGTGGYDLDDDRYSVNYPRQGETYSAQAWVRLPVGAPVAPNAIAYLFLRQWPSDGVPGPLSFGPPTYLDQNWRLVTVQHTMTADAFGLDLFLGGDEVAPVDCFLADDIALRRL